MQIALIDSGIGGLTLLKRLMLECPYFDYIYFADTYAHPYGKQNEFSLRARLSSIVELLYERGAQIIIFACNTATTVALSSIKQTLPIPIFGVKPICSCDNALIMCTPLTRAGQLVKSYEEKGIKVYANGDLASLVEENSNDFNRLNDYIKKELTPYIGVGKVVLGCTHYVFIRKIIEGALGVKTEDCFGEIVDAVKEFHCDYAVGSVEFMFTGPRKEKEYREILGMI